MRRVGLAFLVAVISLFASPVVPGQGINIEVDGLAIGKDPFDNIVGKAFVCMNQHGKKRNADVGVKAPPCLVERALKEHLAREHAAGSDLEQYLRQRRGVCNSAGHGRACRVVREVTRRIPTGDAREFLFWRTIFTIDIDLDTGGAPIRIVIDRHDFAPTERSPSRTPV